MDIVFSPSCDACPGTDPASAEARSWIDIRSRAEHGRAAELRRIQQHAFRPAADDTVETDACLDPDPHAGLHETQRGLRPSRRLALEHALNSRLFALCPDQARRYEH